MHCKNFFKLSRTLRKNSLAFKQIPRPFAVESMNETFYGVTELNAELKVTTLKSLREKFERGVALTAITAYDYSSAMHVRISLDVYIF